MSPALRIDGHQIFECEACDHWMTWSEAAERHTTSVFDDAYFEGGGAGYPGYTDEAAELTARGDWYAAKVAPRLRPGARVLDVGTAAGFALRAFENRGFRALGLEPNQAQARYAREVLGVEVQETTLERFEEPRGFHLICLFQVISHLVDPKIAVGKLRRLLAPGGLLLIETWDRRSWTARILGGRWHQYSPPSVLHWFSEAGLRRLLEHHGFELLDSGRAFKRLSWRHARSLIGYKLGAGVLGRGFRRCAAALSDRWVLRYPFDDARWYLFRLADGGEGEAS